MILNNNDFNFLTPPSLVYFSIIYFNISSEIFKSYKPYDSFHFKYLKYKKKYLELKKQLENLEN